MKYLVLGTALGALATLTGAVSYRLGHRHPDVVGQSLPPLEGGEVISAASAPKVPPPLARTYATKVVLDVEIREHTKMLADGVSYTY